MTPFENFSNVGVQLPLPMSNPDRPTVSSASVFATDYDSIINNGTEIVHVRDKRLASALMAVGIRLRKDPAYVQIKKKSGQRVTIFNFLPRDDEGVFNTIELIKAWGQDLAFIEANPLHPFTFAMCALRNYQDTLDHLTNDTPYVEFVGRKNGRKATTLVKEGSRKHKEALRRGLTQA